MDEDRPLTPEEETRAASAYADTIRAARRPAPTQASGWSRVTPNAEIRARLDALKQKLDAQAAAQESELERARKRLHATWPKRVQKAAPR